MAKPKSDPVERFLALSDSEKEQELPALNRQIPLSESRPLTTPQRKRWARIQKQLKRGRPKIGEGAKIVPISIERGLLKRADAFAKRHKLKRSQLIAQALRLVMQPRWLRVSASPMTADQLVRGIFQISPADVKRIVASRPGSKAKRKKP